MSHTDTLVVTTKAPSIDSQDGTVADSKNFEQVTRLPMNTRALTSSPFGAVVTAPGVQADRAGRVAYLSTRRSITTEKIPDTPLARMFAMSLSDCVDTTPSRVTLPLSTMM